MVKKNKNPKKYSFYVKILLLFFCGVVLGSLVLTSSAIYHFEKSYQNKIYPGVKVDGIHFGGKTPADIENYFNGKNQPLSALKLVFVYEDKIATVSSSELEIAYDSKLSAVQAYDIGRSGNFLSDIYNKWKAIDHGINLTSILKFNNSYLNEVLEKFSQTIDIAPQDALFQFENGKVTSFKMSQNGRRLNIPKTREMVNSYIISLRQNSSAIADNKIIELPVEPVSPQITTEGSNNYGIRESIGVGSSKFAGSIPGRVHNIELAASRINGHLVPKDAVFSFNDTLGDVSASTGFQPAYIIKEGRTVLGDGGGVCQVSTTLFRAAMNAGLTITERHPHSYRVGYYEQDSGPGLDATVFAPSFDLKFKNDTPGNLLIQAKTDRDHYSLVFEIYGTKDGRQSEVTKPIILSQVPPPPDLYQDDPTLPVGTVKQVDWKAWGAKVKFNYKVTRDNNILIDEELFSNFQPWQAVFLRGTRQ